MSKLSNDAFAVLAMCEDTKMPFGITVDKLSRGHYAFIWSFKIDKAKAHREGFDQTHVNGAISIDDGFPGCPYCGAKAFYICGTCGTIVCHHGRAHVTCPNCGTNGEIHSAETFEIKGGGF